MLPVEEGDKIQSGASVGVGVVSRLLCSSARNAIGMRGAHRDLRRSGVSEARLCDKQDLSFPRCVTVAKVCAARNRAGL